MLPNRSETQRRWLAGAANKRLLVLVKRVNLLVIGLGYHQIAEQAERTVHKIRRNERAADKPILKRIDTLHSQSAHIHIHRAEVAKFWEGTKRHGVWGLLLEVDVPAQQLILVCHLRE